MNSYEFKNLPAAELFLSLKRAAGWQGILLTMRADFHEVRIWK